MKINATFKKVARRLLWAIALLLLLFITFMFGGTLAILGIQNECDSSEMFTIDTSVYQCYEVIQKPKGEMS